MAIFDAPLMGEGQLPPEHGGILTQLKDDYDRAVQAGDIDAANRIKRQKDMFLKDPEAFSPERTAASKGDEYINELAETVRNYWRGFDPTGVLGEQSIQEPRSGYGVAGGLTGALAANPFDIGKKPPVRALQAAAEGYTAPARSEEERRGNALLGMGASFGLSGLGGIANRTFDLSADNPNLRPAVRYAKRENLDPPYVDDYSGDLASGLGGWLVDQPMLVGRTQQFRRGRGLEKHAVRQAESRQLTEGLEESVRRQFDADYVQSQEMYGDLWTRYPQVINDEPFMQSMDVVQEQMQPVMHLLPRKISKRVTDLINTESRDLKGWHEVRSLMREHTEQMKRKGTAGRKYFTDAVDNIDNMMKNSLDDRGRILLRQADEFYSERMPKYREITALSDALRKGDGDQVFETLIKPSTSEFSGRKMWNSLDDEGQANALALLHKRAVSEGMKEGTFSPTKYANFWRKFGSKADYLNDTDREQIEGLQALYGLAKGAEESGSHWIQSRAVGNTLAMAGLGGAGALATAGMFTPQDMFTGLATTATLAALLRTRMGNKFLRGIGKAQNAAEAAKATYQFQKAIVRSPQLATEVGISPEDREAMGASLMTIDMGGQQGYDRFIDAVSGSWNQWQEWGREKASDYQKRQGG